MGLKTIVTDQSVVSKIIECWLKNWKGLQDAAGHLAWGIPHPLGSGDPAVRSEGIEPLGKKYTAIPESSHCTKVNGEKILLIIIQHLRSDVLAYTPPLLPLKPGPNELLLGDLIPHPWFPDWAAAQFVPPTTDPEMSRTEELEEEIVHPGLVCIVALEESYSETMLSHVQVQGNY